MAINKFMEAALRAASYADIDVKKNYQVERAITRLVHPSIKLLYKIWDHKINRNGYDIPVRIFFPTNQVSDELILFFHGGGWVTGDIDSYSNVCAGIANSTGMRVASVDYRLAPEYPFPCGLDDCYYVALEMHKNQISDIPGGAIGKITIAGDSAGGNLSAAVSLMAVAQGDFTVEQQMLFYPALYYDHSENSPFESVRTNGRDYILTSKRICDYMDLYLPDKEKRINPYFAPLVADEKMLCGQPKTLIVTAEFDPLRDEGEAYGEKLRQSGNDAVVVRMANALHGFLSLPPRFTHVVKSHELINRFLKEGTLNGNESEKRS